MDLIGFFKVLLKRIWLILGIALIAAAATFIIARRTSRVYLSKAQLATGITQSALPSTKEGMDAMSANAEFSNLIEVITSKQVLSMLSYKLMIHDLTKEYPFKKTDELKQNYSPEQLAMAKIVYKNKLDSIQLLHTNESTEKIYAEMIKDQGHDLKTIEEGLEVYRVNNTDYIEIRYKSKNPWLSAFIVNNLSEEIIRYYRNLNNKRLENSVKYFADLSAQKKKELDAKLDSMNRYKTTRKVINFEEERKSKMSQIERLEDAKDEETKKILGLKQALASLNSRLNEGNDENYDQQYTNNKVLTLKNKINALQEKYINSGNRDKSARDSIEILKEELETQVGKFGNTIDISKNTSKQDLTSKKINTEIELEMAKSNLSSIESSLYGLRNNLTGFATNENSIAAMEMAITVAKDEYLNVLDKFNSAKNYSISTNNLHQIEYGEPADEPEPSKVVLLTLVAGVGSIAFCIVVLFTLEYVDSTIKRPSHFTSLTDAPLIGSINQLKSTKVNFEELFSKVHKSQVLEHHKQLIRKLRYEIESTKAKTFLFTSTKANEGKSFIIVSLAYSLALSGKKILIIDTNLKSNSLTKLFNAKPGLKHFFVKNEKGFKRDSEIVNATQVQGIEIVGSEPNNYSPREIIDENTFSEFLLQAKERYDYIFMEAASLNLYSDTKELQTYADKILAVFSAKSAIKKSDKTSVGYLLSLNDKFAGSVLNKVDMENLDQ